MLENYADKEKLKKSLSTVIRAGKVRRYHTVELVKERPLSEHVYRMLGVARTICTQTDVWSADLAEAILLHDVPECATGDIPAPLKSLLREQWLERGDGCTNRLDESEEEVFKTLYPFHTHFTVPELRLGKAESFVFKASDAIEGLVTCAEERSMGNKTLYLVQERWYQHVRQLIMKRPSDMLDEDILNFERCAHNAAIITDHYNNLFHTGEADHKGVMADEFIRAAAYPTLHNGSSRESRGEGVSSGVAPLVEELQQQLRSSERKPDAEGTLQ